MVEIDGKDGVSLKQYLRDYVDIRLAALEKAETLAHQIVKVEHKSVCDDIERLERMIRDLELSRAELQGKASQQSVMIAQAIAIVGLIVTVVLHFLT